MRALVITNTITRRDEKSMDKYFNEISAYDVLTPEEEVALFKRYQDGDEEAYARIVLCNLRFVVSVAKQYQHLGLWLGDLINEGNIGLIKAVQRFDITRGFKFISYAVWWIRQSILHAVNERSRKIRLPLNQKTKVMKIEKTRTELLQKMEREPTDHELSEECELAITDIRKSRAAYKKCSSLDAPVGEDETATFGQLMEDRQIVKPDHNLAVEESMKQEVAQMLSGLPEQTAKIIAMYYGVAGEEKRTLNDISDCFDLSRERIRQIIKRGITKLRANGENFAFSSN